MTVTADLLEASGHSASDPQVGKSRKRKEDQRLGRLDTTGAQRSLMDAIALRGAIARGWVAGRRQRKTAADDADLINHYAAMPDIPPVLRSDSRQSSTSPVSISQALSTLARDAVARLGTAKGRIRECGADDCQLILRRLTRRLPPTVLDETVRQSRQGPNPPEQERQPERGRTMTITQVNPAALHRNPAFSQATVAEGTRTLYIGGQNGTDASGEIKGGIAEQTTQALRNVLEILKEINAGPQDVAKMNVYLVESADVSEGFGATGEVWGQHPTAVTVLKVPALARPDALVEVDAIAVL